MTKTYTITANAIEASYEAENSDAAILAYVIDAGYASIEEAAEVCGKSVEDFLADIHVVEA